MPVCALVIASFSAVRISLDYCCTLSSMSYKLVYIVTIVASDYLKLQSFSVSVTTFMAHAKFILNTRKQSEPAHLRQGNVVR